MAQSFKHHAFFRVVAHDEKRYGRHNIRRNHDEDFLTRYEVDRRSVFVGGLPSNRDISELEERLWALGDSIGNVEKVQVIQKDGPRNGMPHSRGLSTYLGLLTDVVIARCQRLCVRGVFTR